MMMYHTNNSVKPVFFRERIELSGAAERRPLECLVGPIITIGRTHRRLRMNCRRRNCRSIDPL
jgi:hypothetical protein